MTPLKTAAGGLVSSSSSSERRRGQAINAKVADWIAAHNDANRNEQKRDTTAMHWRYVLMALLIVTAAGLKVTDKLDSSIVGFLGLSLGYLFGRAEKKSE